MHKSEPLDFNALPVRSPEFAATLGPTVVIVPHPDDESLGCGGLLALLAQAAQPVWCVLVSDGTMSHPNSVKFPPAARQALRETELQDALQELGVGSHLLQTLNLPDGAVPTSDTPAGSAAAKQLHNFLRQIGATTILCPWRRDPHPDHRATSELVRAALAQLPQPPRLLEYVVWAWERASPTDLPHTDEAVGWRLDVTPVLARKQRAIAAHRSQLAPSIIDDDPAGFVLSAGMLAHFAQPYEVYLEAKM
ncbi:PIG-L deacetylase family protein [Hymenobacter sediminicola]|uniref:PIG-L family deacetylase n=1 Tax=Hymenobacter sediminicola TaxID=2761579 RepID=A0A7G7W5X5_9BACT|nr:PIG-L family deacetylase [Hymenobacter sediminicola]QNH61768.1 PIG-L family deacetylase [Hymenobacter sediminicola]